MGDRLSQTVGITTTHYVLDPGAGLTQVLADGTNTYLYGNGRLAQYQAAMQYFGADGLGSVRQLYDASGQVLANNRYDPYGNVLSHFGDATSVFGFTGEQYDAATGLEYLRARYYSSAQGRFTTRDTWQGAYTVPLSLNRWNYVQANPVLLTDPSGRVAPLVILGVFLVAAGTAALIDEVNQVNSYAQRHNMGFWEAWNSPRLELDQSSMIDSGVKVGFLSCLVFDSVPALIGLGGLSLQQQAIWTNNPQTWYRGTQWLNTSATLSAPDSALVIQYNSKAAKPGQPIVFTLQPRPDKDFGRISCQFAPFCGNDPLKGLQQAFGGRNVRPTDYFRVTTIGQLRALGVTFRIDAGEFVGSSALPPGHISIMNVTDPEEFNKIWGPPMPVVPPNP